MKTMMANGDPRVEQMSAERGKCARCNGEKTIKIEAVFDTDGRQKSVTCPLCRGSGKNLQVITK